MLKKVLLALVLGILSGYICHSQSFYISVEWLDFFQNIILFLLIFSVGIGIGKNTDIFKKALQSKKTILLLPLYTTAGTLLGAIVGAVIVGITLSEGLAVGFGLGWYSLSAGILSIVSISLATIAFLSNVLRESFALILIPYLSKKGYVYSAISLAGATSMDVCLPLIMKSSNDDYLVVSLIHGLLCSLISLLSVSGIVLIL